jgi:hypothetical protein
VKYFERFLTMPYLKSVVLIMIIRNGDLPLNHLQQHWIIICKNVNPRRRGVTGTANLIVTIDYWFQRRNLLV